ncbi:MAG: DUF4159 domain-containing protein [Acidobacteriota bacterium]
MTLAPSGSLGAIPDGAKQTGARLGLIAAALALLAVAPALQSGVAAQRPTLADDRYAGLQWRFVRIKYHFVTEGTQIPQDFAGEPWFIDAPAAEQNLSRRLKTATAIHVEDPIVLPIEDPRLFEYPWIYIVEPGTLKLLDTDVTTLREYFLRGGTAMFDDFHGPLEWENFEHEIKRVFPSRPIVEVPRDHPVFSAVYKIDGYPQVAGIGSFMQGRTWEKGGFVPHLRTILDDSGRPMMFINWNTDMGDGWEWSNVVEFPQYVKYTSMAYQMAINEIVYSLTH